MEERPGLLCECYCRGIHGPALLLVAVTGTSPEVADEDVATLMSFGFAEVAARNALAHCVRTSMAFSFLW